jgi:AcrR family transcriptional regulator
MPTVPTVSVRAAQKEQTRERVLLAALELLAASRTLDVRLEDVATQAKVAKGTVLFHFGSRNGLLHELVQRLYDEVVKDIAELAGPRGPGGTMAFIRANLHVHRRPKLELLWRLGDVLSHENPDSTGSSLAAVYVELEARLLAEGLPPDAAETLAVLIAPALLMTARQVAVHLARALTVDRFIAAVESTVAEALERLDGLAVNA